MKPFKLSLEEFTVANNLILGNKKWFYETLYVLAVFGILGILLVILSLVGTDTNFFNDPLPYVFGAFVGIIFVVIAPKKKRNNLSKIYNSHPAFQEEIQITFNNEFVEWKSSSASFKLKWADATNYKQNETMLVIFTGKYYGRSVPLRAFESDTEKMKFLEFLKLRTN